MNTRTNIGFATALVGAALSLAGLVLPGIASASNSSNSNDASYWVNRGEHPGALCYKHGNSGSNTHGKVQDGAVILNTFNQSWPGDHWELLVVKGGSNQNGGGDAVYQHPQAGMKYYPPMNPQSGKPFGVSHWIVCKGTTPAVTTTTAAPTTTAESTTTTAAPTTTAESTTTTAAPTTTTTVDETTTTSTIPDESSTTSSTIPDESSTTSSSIPDESTTTTEVGSEGPTTTARATTTTIVGSNGPTTTAKSGSGGGTLPQTGSGSDMLLMLGLGLVLGGGIFVAMGRRPEEA